MGGPSTWCVFPLSSFVFLSYYRDCSSNDVFLLIFAALNHLDLEDRHRHRVRTALAYTCEIEDFDDLVDPRHLFDCYLGPEPSKYVFEKIRRKEKSKIACLLTSSLLAPSVPCLTAYLKIAPLFIIIIIIIIIILLNRHGHQI